jgi:hypothetical protein
MLPTQSIADDAPGGNSHADVAVSPCGEDTEVELLRVLELHRSRPGRRGMSVCEYLS